MMTEADRAGLDESYRNTRMGREAINVIIGKVEDDDLALDLNRQACKFIQLEEKLQKEYHKEKETPPEDSIMNRTRLWSGIQIIAHHKKAGFYIVFFQRVQDKPLLYG